MRHLLSAPRVLGQRLLAEPRILALLDQAIVSGSNFLTLVFIGRRLAAEDFGSFSLAMMGTLFLSNLHRAFFTQPMNVLGAAEPSNLLAGRLLTVLRAHLLAIPLAAGLLALLSAVFFPGLALQLAAIGYITCFFLQETLRRYWYTIGRVDLALVNDLISYAGQLLLLVAYGSVWHIDGPSAYVIMSLTSLAAFAVGISLVDRTNAAARPVGGVLNQHWGLAKWLLLTVLAVWGAGQVYPFLVAPLGPVIVASFAACRNLLNAIGIVVQSIGNYLPPRAALLLRQEGPCALRRHLIGTLMRVGAFAAAFLAIILLWAEPLLHLVYTGTYDNAAPLFRVLVFGTVCSLFGAVLGSYALAMEDSRSGFLANLGASIFTFTIGLWMIRAQGIMGAAIATSLSLATAMVLQAAFVLYRLTQLNRGGQHA